jgi:hypothetical protein
VNQIASRDPVAAETAGGGAYIQLAARPEDGLSRRRPEAKT